MNKINSNQTVIFLKILLFSTLDIENLVEITGSMYLLLKIIFIFCAKLLIFAKYRYKTVNMIIKESILTNNK